MQYAKIIKDRIWSFDSTKQSSYHSFECVWCSTEKELLNI